MTNQQQPKMRFVDIPELPETFADSLGDCLFDGGLLRVVFTTTRMDKPKPPNPSTGRRYPACRLVLTAQAAQDLHDFLNHLAATIEQARKDQTKPTVQ